MGAPATDYFCKNGHNIGGAPHHCICKLDELSYKDFPPCPYCGSEQFACQFEWGDDDYKQLVPLEPIKYDDCPFLDHHGNKYFKKIMIYDVKKLFEKNRKEE
jgi:hypothetical protein